VFIWVRGTFPRLRMDQLMSFAWKFMLPMTLTNLFAAGIWHFMPSGILRWLVSATLIVVPFILFSRGAQKGKKLQIRTYRYAE